MSKRSPYEVRPALAGLHPYEPGRPIEEIEAKYGLDSPPVKLASNENPYSPPEQLKEIYCQEFSQLNRYPDGGSYYLREALSEKYDWPMDGIVVGAGSDEVLDCLAKAMLEPGCEIVCGDPSFVIYQMDALKMGARPVTVKLTRDFQFDLEAMVDAVTENTRWVCLPNPNNPTARYITTTQLEEFFAALPSHCLLLLDEAYFEFIDSEDYPDGIEFLKNRTEDQAGLVVLRTFSKAYALPGLRVGYGLMEPRLARELHKVRPPFNITRPTQAVAVEALKQEEFLAWSREKIISERRRLEVEFESRGIDFVQPSANFILAEAPGDLTADELFEKLLPEGVIIRSMSPYGLEKHVRITVGKPIENQILLSALDNVCGF